MIKSMKFLAVGLGAVLLLAGCQDVKPNSQVREQASIEANQNRLITALPAPALETSLERQNLIERLKRINSQNMTGYIYLISYGRVMAFYPVKGKVTSLNAYLMGSERLMRDPYAPTGAGVAVTIEQPDYDGAYGKNADGIFFFTTEGAYVEWNAEYLWSDQPLALSQEPLMVRQIEK